MATVPDTTTFNLQNVVDAVNPTTDDLIDCFNDADMDLFDQAYYDTGNDMLEFRNYGETEKDYIYFYLPGPFSFNATGTPIQTTRVWHTGGGEGWYLYSITSWINENERTSESAVYYDVTCDTNSSYDRSGSIVVYDLDSDTYATLNVTQSGPLGPEP